MSAGAMVHDPVTPWHGRCDFFVGLGPEQAMAQRRFAWFRSPGGGLTPSGIGSSGIGGTTTGSASAPTPLPQGGTAPSTTPGSSTIQR